LVEWRLSALEEGQDSITRKLDKVLDNQNKNMLAQEGAINRCGNWGREIEVMRDTELPALSARVSNLESSDRTQVSTAKPEDAKFVTGRTWPDVFFNPATPIAFAAILLLIALVVVISAKTGRDVDSFVPHAVGSP